MPACFFTAFSARTMADYQPNVNLTEDQLIIVYHNGGLSRMRIIQNNFYMIMADGSSLRPLSSLRPPASHGGGGLTTPYDPSEAGGGSERTLDYTPRPYSHIEGSVASAGGGGLTTLPPYDPSEAGGGVTLSRL